MEQIDETEAIEPAWHREYRRRSVREGMRRKAEAGGTPGCAPVGYRNRRDGNGNAYVEIDPVQGPLVREAFELMAKGKYSLRGLLAIMTEKGLLSRNGRPMGVSGLWSILHNLPYSGQQRYGNTLIASTRDNIINVRLFECVDSNSTSNS